MKWYYRWKLKRIQRQIDMLQDQSSHPLIEDYTANSKLRILKRLAEHLQERLAGSSTPSPQH